MSKRLLITLTVLLMTFYNILILPAGEDRSQIRFNDSVAEAAYGSSDNLDSNNRPILIIKNISYAPETVEAGNETTVTVTLTNDSNKAAKDIKITLTGLKSDEFTLAEKSDTKYLKSLGANRDTKLEFSLLASAKMTSGNYSLGVSASYQDEQQQSYTDDYNVFIKVQGKEKNADVAINNIIVTPKEVKSNESFSLTFTVKNNGKTRADNIKVSVKGDEGILSKSPDIQMIESLEPGKSHAADFTLFAGGDELKSKHYNIQISLEYEDAAKGDAKVTVNQYTGVNVNTSNGKLIPKIIINSYRFKPVVVRAGERFSLEMSFLNTSSARTVNNIKVYLTGIDSDKEGKIVFTPVGSSNTFFIDSIKPKGIAGRNLIMYTIPNAEPQTYTVTANIEYQDEDGTEHKATELIGIPVIQQSQLTAGEISLPPEAFIGEPTPISLEFYNTGKTKLNNVMVRVNGDFDVQEKQLFVGNFDSGSYDYFETNIIPTKAGQLNGEIIFTFDDPSGEPQEYVREFTVNAVEAPPFDPSEQMPEEKTNEGRNLLTKALKNKSFWAGLGVGLAVTIIAGIVLSKKKRKQSIEFNEDE
ncbi:CARDB domain-containing protein [Desulfoscipio sp. XC116]|uniref:COG1361 S-layer family protein n=1 Tax=Desulfoscipio sp. XC116 TaxID=3144975 RepID=UPI00325C1ED8